MAASGILRAVPVELIGRENLIQHNAGLIRLHVMEAHLFLSVLISMVYLFFEWNCLTCFLGGKWRTKVYSQLCVSLQRKFFSLSFRR